MLTRYVQHHLTWIDLVSPTPQEVRSLMQEFNIDPLIAEELLVPSYKPKVEKRGEAVYVILHFPVLRGLQQRPEAEIDFVLGKNFLITARYGAVDPLHVFAKAFEVDSVLGRRGGLEHGGHLFAAMTHSLYHALENECDALHRRLSQIEDKIFTGNEREMVIELSQTGRVLFDFRQSLVPHQEMIRSLEPVGGRMFGPEFAFHIRSVEGDYTRVTTLLSHLRESLIELRETNNSLLSTKQNEIMKTFTVLAFIFLPMTFIAGLFGMNTVNNPIVGSQYDFWIVVGMMVLVGALCYGYFKRKGWL